MDESFAVGDAVVCDLPGSWVHGERMVVIATGVTSSDGVRGVYLQAGCGVTVVGPEHLIKV